MCFILPILKFSQHMNWIIRQNVADYSTAPCLCHRVGGLRVEAGDIWAFGRVGLGGVLFGRVEPGSWVCFGRVEPGCWVVTRRVPEVPAPCSFHSWITFSWVDICVVSSRVRAGSVVRMGMVGSFWGLVRSCWICMTTSWVSSPAPCSVGRICSRALGCPMVCGSVVPGCVGSRVWPWVVGSGLLGYRVSWVGPRVGGPRPLGCPGSWVCPDVCGSGSLCRFGSRVCPEVCCLWALRCSFSLDAQTALISLLHLGIRVLQKAKIDKMQIVIT